MNWQDETREGRGPSKAGDVIADIGVCIAILFVAVVILQSLGLLPQGVR